MSSRNVQFPLSNVLEGSRFSPTLLAISQFVGFWLAVILPLAYLPLLVGGLSDWQLPTFGVLFTLHVFALIAGHGYGRDAD